jgi:hypothetical protein
VAEKLKPHAGGHVVAKKRDARAGGAAEMRSTRNTFLRPYLFHSISLSCSYLFHSTRYHSHLRHHATRQRATAPRDSSKRGLLHGTTAARPEDSAARQGSGDTSFSKVRATPRHGPTVTQPNFVVALQGTTAARPDDGATSQGTTTARLLQVAPAWAPPRQWRHGSMTTGLDLGLTGLDLGSGCFFYF